MNREERVTELRRTKSRNWYLRISAIVVVVMVAWAWLTSNPLFGRLSAERRWRNFQNFVSELVPNPVDKSGNWLDAIPWAWELLSGDGFVALMTTLGIATAAIILASTFVLPFLPMANRRFSRKDPFGLPGGQVSAPVAILWRIIGPFVRFSFVICRAIPEYLLAFLLISLLGLQVWPLVLALAIHNFGILGRLWGEVVENADAAAAKQRLASGTSRFNVFGTTVFPDVFNRFLIYFFYRWETCLKDATVLGMLGLLTLGKLIALAKGFHWDRMFFYIMLGASVIIVGDLFSSWMRSKLR